MTKTTVEALQSEAVYKGECFIDQDSYYSGEKKSGHFSTHYFNKEKKEIGYQIWGDGFTFDPVKLNQPRIWGKEIMDKLLWRPIFS